MFEHNDTWPDRTETKDKVNGIIGQVNAIGVQRYPEAFTLAFNMPALPGLGIVGGWTMELQDMTGHTDEELNSITQKLVAAANQRPELQGVRSTFKINSPNYIFEVDREKVKNLGINLADVFTALQVNYGGYQVNDFNQFGRTYKVMAATIFTSFCNTYPLISLLRIRFINSCCTACSQRFISSINKRTAFPFSISASISSSL